jgi:hypothetical protein
MIMYRTLTCLLLLFLLAACSVTPGNREALDPASPLIIESPVTSAPTSSDEMSATIEQPTDTPSFEESEGDKRIPLGQSQRPEDIAEIARQNLAARLGLPLEQVAIDGFERAEWQDLSLGCSVPDDKYATRQDYRTISGYRIVLSANDKAYQYHSGDEWLVFCGRAKVRFEEQITLPTLSVQEP